MALGITSIFVEKTPILCVTGKKHKKGNPPTGSGIPELIPVKIPIWGSPNRFRVHSKLGTNICTQNSKFRIIPYVCIDITRNKGTKVQLLHTSKMAGGTNSPLIPKICDVR